MKQGPRSVDPEVFPYATLGAVLRDIEILLLILLFFPSRQAFLFLRSLRVLGCEASIFLCARRVLAVKLFYPFGMNAVP